MSAITAGSRGGKLCAKWQVVCVWQPLVFSTVGHLWRQGKSPTQEHLPSTNGATLARNGRPVSNRSSPGSEIGVGILAVNVSGGILQSLLAAGVDLSTATQMAVVQVLERLGSGPKDKEKRKNNRIFGLDEAEEEEEEGSGSSGEDGGGLPAMASAKGAAASIRLRDSMRRHPKWFAADMRKRAVDSLKEPSFAFLPEVMLRYATRGVPVQNQKARGYLLFGLVHFHRLLMENKKGEAEFFILR